MAVEAEGAAVVIDPGPGPGDLVLPATAQCHLRTAPTLILYPHLVMEVAFQEYDVGGIEVPIDLPVLDDPITFDTIEMTFPRWEDASHAECAEACVEFVDDIMTRASPQCEQLLLDVLMCASEIQTCDQFVSFEINAHGEFPPIPHPCRDERAQQVPRCRRPGPSPLQPKRVSNPVPRHLYRSETK